MVGHWCLAERVHVPAPDGVVAAGQVVPPEVRTGTLEKRMKGAKSPAKQLLRMCLVCSVQYYALLRTVLSGQLGRFIRTVLLWFLIVVL